ncbi:MAG: response regulator transcription factor, partial [Anaerolineales bacterium]|nr:response regulator transcription factor [Anaerolineales bacterium]
ASIALLLLSHLCLMRNEMAQARQFMQQATVVDPNPTSSNMPVNIAITRAKLQAALGNHEAAWSSIRAARALQAQRPSGGWRDQDLIAYEAMFRLPEGDWDEIERLLAEVGDDEHPVGLLVRAEMLLAQNQAAAAEELLQRFLDSYPNGIAAEPSLNARLLLTLALYEGHKLNQARQLLAEVIRSAAPERFIQPFLTHGRRLVPLLALLQHMETVTSEAEAFVNELLGLLGFTGSISELFSSDELQSMITAASITQRELEVLQLVRDGYSNRQIGLKLCIAPGTVKTHLAHIYGKLEVNNRVQAVSEARMLQLI